MSDVTRLPKDGNICLIDADSLVYYEMDKPTLELAIQGIDARIKNMLDVCNTTLFAGFMTEGRCFRYKVTSSYKGNRKGRPKPPIFYALKAHLKQKYGFWALSALEADDLVCYYSFTDNRKTIVCSPDKDVLYQCIGMHYNYQKAHFQHTTPEEALKFLWKQVLMGDSTDGIPGLPGVGSKTSDNWLKTRVTDFEGFALKKYVEKFGMVEGVFKFHETFRLVYLLRSSEDITRETGLVLPALEVSQLEPQRGSDGDVW
jgi:hypothetical protein